MKKFILPVLLCVILIFTVSCGNSPSESTDSTVDDAGNGMEVASGDDTPQKEDVFGSITEIVGNLATIKLAVMPEDGIPVPGARRMVNFDPENMPEGMEIATNADGSFSIPEGAQGRFNMGGDGNFTMPEGMEIATNADGSFSIPEGAQGRVSRGDGSGVSFNMGDGAITRNEDGSITLADGSTISAEDMQTRGQGGGGFNTAFLDYTGDEIEFILPIGIPIYAVTKDEEGNQVETEIELGDIANNNVISVSYRPDGKTVDKILVSQVTATERPEGLIMPGVTEVNTEDNGGGDDE